VTSRLYVLRRRFFDSNANTFDLLIVGIDLFLEIVALVAHDVILSISVLRVLRVARAMRFVRAIRTLVIFRELYMMMHGFLSAMKAIVWAIVLLGVVLTLYSIVAVKIIHPLNKRLAEESDVYDDCERCPRAFESVPASIMTFVQVIVAGDGGGVITVPLVEAHPSTTLFFLMVLVTVNLGLMNLILSVIVDKAQQAHSEDVEFHLQQRDEDCRRATKQLRNLAPELDKDGSGKLTLAELLQGYTDVPMFKESCTTMDVGHDDISSVFVLLDEDGSGDVDFKEFVEQLYTLKTQETKHMLVNIKSRMKELEGEVKKSMEHVKNQLALKTRNDDQAMGSVLEMLDSLAKTRDAEKEAKDCDAAVKKAAPVDKQEKAVMAAQPVWLDQELQRLRRKVNDIDASLEMILTSALRSTALPPSGLERASVQSLGGLERVSVQSLGRVAECEEAGDIMRDRPVPSVSSKGSGVPAVVQSADGAVKSGRCIGCCSVERGKDRDLVSNV